MSNRHIAIIGAGNGGLAAAADLASRGMTVSLFESPEFLDGFRPIVEAGGIWLEDELGERFVKLGRVTASIQEALEGVDTILVVAPSYATDGLTRMVSPHLKDNQNLIFCPGSSGNALAAAAVLRGYPNLERIALGEISTLPYAARRDAGGRVKILLKASTLFFAALPGARTLEISESLRDLYEGITPVANVLETSLNNGNPVTHPAPTVMNTARIESRTPFLFYQEGITPAVARVNESIDEERMNLCEALGFKRIPGRERLYLTGYSPRTSSLYEAYKRSVPFSPIKGPVSLKDRYLVEDVGYGLVFWSSIGKLIGVPTPVSDAIIVLASTLNGVDYMRVGRNLDNLGLGGRSIGQIIDYVTYGKMR